ncbi:unnamed protein product [Coregonus sp. 'balchen']|nr:unnamed protein product [Coregonus sp. 'balchen']
MDVEVKLDERDRPISPAVVSSDRFDTQAGYVYDINPHEATPQQMCGILSKDTGARDWEVKAESIGLTTVGTQDREITDSVLVPSINTVFQDKAAKIDILNTNVEGKNVHVHTEQHNPSTSVKDESCFEIPPSDIQIGKVFTLSQSPLLAAESQVSPHIKETMFNETDVPQSAVETATLGLQNGPTDICIKEKSHLEFTSAQHVNMKTISTDTDVSLSDEEAVHRHRRDQSFMKSTTEDKMKDLYPLCKKIVCGTYRQIVLAVLEYNFDLDFQNDIDLLENIINNIRIVEKKRKSWLKEGNRRRGGD